MSDRHATTCAHVFTNAPALKRDSKRLGMFEKLERTLSPSSALALTAAKQQLVALKYARTTSHHYAIAMTRFLAWCDAKNVDVKDTLEHHVDEYIDKLRPRRSAKKFDNAKSFYRSGIKFLMRSTHAQWPPARVPSSPAEKADQELFIRHRSWMTDVCGYAKSTQVNKSKVLISLVEWCRRTERQLRDLGLADLDAYIAERGCGLGRVSLADLVSNLRGTLKYLFCEKVVGADLSKAPQGPRIYREEGLPSSPTQAQIGAAIKASVQDQSPLGMRDHAILLLLTTYGLRSGEILRLRIQDIDWRHDCLRIRHWKTGTCSTYPLLEEVGNALLNYLEHGRPKSRLREVFLRHDAPYKALVTPSAFFHMLERLFQRAGVQRCGKRGAHSLRHAKAISLLRQGESLKMISDLLGHSSPRSTTKYLKLATEDLRHVALEVPCHRA